MDDLDLLKKDWQKPNAFEQISDREIYGMLHKKSSSIVKWIFYVSIMELGLGFLIGFFLKFTKYDDQGNQLIEKMGLYNYYIVTSIIIYGIVLYFIYNFYKMYSKISTTDNSKQLIFNILKTRKVVKQYILFNLSTFAILFLILGSFTFHQNYLDYCQKNGIFNPDISLTFILKSSLILIAITSIFTGVFWFFYKLIYGILLKRLHKNYEELKKIDL
jgi:hypothetical protein